MDYDEFRVSLSKVYDYFQAKEASPATMKLWSFQVKHIPNGPPLRFIEQEMMDRDSLPRNIPKAYKAAWDSWMMANQDQISRQREESKETCEYCHAGSGMIFSKKIDNGKTYSFVSRCPHCRNWIGSMHESVVPVFTKEHLLNNGFVIEG